MARGRDDAPKKPGTSSSVSEGRVWEVPSQKEKNRFNYRPLNYKGSFLGGLIPVPGTQALERSFCAHHKRLLHLLKPKRRASNEALFRV